MAIGPTENSSSADVQGWYNIEDNSDWQTSDEDFMSSSSSQEEEEEEQKMPRAVSFGSSTHKAAPESSVVAMKELTRVEKAVISQRFEPYFERKKIDAQEYFKYPRAAY